MNDEDLEDLAALRDRSVTLNRMRHTIGAALGRHSVADLIRADPEELLAQLIAEVTELRTVAEAYRDQMRNEAGA